MSEASFVPQLLSSVNESTSHLSAVIFSRSSAAVKTCFKSHFIDFQNANVTPAFERIWPSLIKTSFHFYPQWVSACWLPVKNLCIEILKLSWKNSKPPNCSALWNYSVRPVPLASALSVTWSKSEEHTLTSQLWPLALTVWKEKCGCRVCCPWTSFIS